VCVSLPSNIRHVLCTTVMHSDMHTHEQLLRMNVGLGLGFDGFVF